jgi:tetratricopeptide (TPR) repeat protein
VPVKLLIMTATVLVLAATGSAAPKKVRRDHAELSDAQKVSHKTMAAELRRGRKLAAKGRHAQAVAALDAALRAVPDEPHVLQELGWELRVAGDLVRAEQVCRKAALASEPALKAPALYNLGRVLEENGDKVGAIAAYVEALKLREDSSVRGRLLDLDPTAQSDAMRPQPLEGPFASLEAWCATHPDEPCQLSDATVSAKLDAPAPPWREVRVFTTGEDGDRSCALALRTSRGWFVTDLGSCSNYEFRYGVTATIASDDVLRSPGPELEVALRGTDAMKDYDPELGHSYCCIETEFSSLTVCGLGPSQVPHCSATLDLLPPLEPSSGASTEIGLEPRYAGDEVILERSDGKPIADAKVRLHRSLRGIAGRHRVIFP